MSKQPAGLDAGALKTRLLNERDELRKESVSTRDEREAVAPDPGNAGPVARMDLMQNQAMAAETERRRQLRLRKIEAALERIGEGEYGWCLSCGKAIAPKRLDIDPAAPVCVKCQERGEA